MLFVLSPQAFHGEPAHSSGLYLLVRCLDPVPRVVVTDIFRLNLHVAMGHHWLTTLFWEYILVMFLFWWWVGWKIDLKTASRGSGPTWTLAEFAVGLTLALMLFFEPRIEHGQGFGLASMVWGVALLCYSLLQLRRGITLMRSTNAVT